MLKFETEAETDWIWKSLKVVPSKKKTTFTETEEKTLMKYREGEKMCEREKNRRNCWSHWGMLHKPVKVQIKDGTQFHSNKNKILLLNLG